MFRNTLLNGLGVLFTIALSLLLVPFSIDSLGIPAYGVWVLALSFSLTGGYLSLADVGLPQGIIKFVAEAVALERHERVNQVVSSALAVFALTGTVAVALLALLAFVGLQVFNVSGDLEQALRLLLFIVAADALFGMPGLAFNCLLQGLERFGAIRLVDFLRQMLYAALVVAVLSQGMGVVAFGAAMGMSTAAGTLGYFLAARRAFPGLSVSRRHVSVTTLRSLMGFSGWLFLSQFNGILRAQMDKVVLATLVGTAVLTGYDVANKVQAVAAAILFSAVSAVMPAASALSADADISRLRELLHRGTRYTLVLLLPAILGGIVMAHPLLVNWVGNRFAGMTRATQILLICQALAAMVAVAHAMLVGLGRVKSATLYASVAVLVNLALSIALASRFGVMGVITGTLVGWLIVVPLYVRLVLGELNVRFFHFLSEAVLPPILWAVAFALVVELTRRAFPPWNLPMVFVACLPGLALYLFGVGRFVMTSEERRMLWGFVRPGTR